MTVDKVKVEREAKEILEKFAKSLEKVEKEHEVEGFVERDIFERLEGESKIIDKGFKERILENALKKDSDFIIAEKGNWK